MRTPSFYLAVLGGMAAFAGLWLPWMMLPGAVLLVVMGWGGAGIALHLETEMEGDPWRVDTVLEALWEAFTLRANRTLYGLVTHVPFGVLGIWLLRS